MLEQTGRDEMQRGLCQLQKRLSWAGLWTVVPVSLFLWFSVPTLKSLHAVWWTSSDYSYGYLVLLLTIFLAARELRRGAMAPLVPSWAGFVLFTLLVFTTLAGNVSSTRAVAQLAWVLSVIAGIWALTGWRNARRLVLPIGYLCIAIPVWSIFLEPMRRLTVFVVSIWIRIGGLPAFIEGNLIHVPSGTFEVAGGCSGLRYTLVAFALATFVSLFHRLRWPFALLLIACALTLAQVGNWLRVFSTVAVGLSPGGSVSLFVRDEHTLFGWIMFVVFMLPLVYLNRVLPTYADKETTSTVMTHKMPRVPRRNTVAYAGCIVLVAGIWLNHQAIFLAEGEPPNSVVLRTPTVNGWDAVADWSDARVPVFVGAVGQNSTWYEDGAARVGVYLATFANQVEDNDVAAVANQPAGTRGMVIARQTVTVEAPRISLPFKELEVVEPGAERSRLVWVGLRVGGHVTASSVVAKFLYVPSVFGGRRDAQALVLTAGCDTNCEDARLTLSRFATAGAQGLYLEAERSLLERQL